MRHEKFAILEVIALGTRHVLLHSYHRCSKSYLQWSGTGDSPANLKAFPSARNSESFRAFTEEKGMEEAA